MKLLIATDGSENAFHAASLVARLPHTGPMEVHILTVIYMPPDDSGGLAYSWLPEFIQSEEERAKEGFSRIADLFTSDEVITNHMICHGHVGHTITQEAKRLGVDLVVVGAKGHSAIARVLLGSTSDFVATQASCSVLAVRPQREGEDESAPLQIAIAYDGSKPSQAAIDEFAQTSWGHKCEVHLVHVLPHASIFSRAAPEDVDAQRKAGLELVRTAGDKLRQVVDDVSTHVLEGDSIGEVITDFADRKGIDIVILGDTGSSALRQLFLGSVTRYVLRHARCSVWIARQPREDHG